MGREGAAALGERLALFAAWRLPPPLCPLVLARCPLLLKEPVESMQVCWRLGRGWGWGGGPGCFINLASASCFLLPLRLVCELRVCAAVQGIADLLVGYSMTWRQLGEVVLGYPPLLRAE
jgi:hypothetical protein